VQGTGRRGRERLHCGWDGECALRAIRSDCPDAPIAVTAVGDGGGGVGGEKMGDFEFMR